MPSSLLMAFDEFPAEGHLVARMVLAYGDLEFAMLDILGIVLSSTNTAVRTMYQLRSEVNRLAVFEAIAEPWFAQAGLAGQFKETMDAVGHCKNIRNQYAHCHWIATDGTLRFCNLEETAKTKGLTCKVRAQPTQLNLLQAQSAYFDYADHMLLWINQEYRKKTSQEERGPWIPKPKRAQPPKLSSRGQPRASR